MIIRAHAARVVADILKQQGSLSQNLSQVLEACSEQDGYQSQDRALLQHLCYGCCRYLPTLELQAKQFLKRPLKRKDSDVQALILLGLYQLSYTRIPPHAVLAETVEAAQTLKKPWAKGLINGVLRNAQRQPEILASLEQDPVYQYAHPRWLIARLRAAWPEYWQQILEQNNEQAPLTLRVSNTADADPRQIYSEQLREHKIAHRLCSFASSAITLEQALPVEALPGFADGLASVQDEAAQLAAPLLDLHPGQRVLDACAAPGGKTCHILDSEPQLAAYLALDNNEGRLQRIRENLERLGLSSQLLCADASQNDWWDGAHFDRILLDAPCSATGVIRRNPDIKTLRQPEDIDRLCTLQQQMLENLWPMLAPGGKLLYATCSVLPEENEQQINRFLEHYQDASEVVIDADWGIARAAGRQLFPQPQGHDGFYYALLVKQSE